MSEPPCINMETAREEANMVLFGTVAKVLKATGTKPQAVDILIVNCSLFNPTPSLSGEGAARAPCAACCAWSLLAAAGDHTRCAAHVCAPPLEPPPPTFPRTHIHTHTAQP